MSKITVSVIVSEHLYNAGRDLAAFVAAARKSLDDGYQTGDLPPLMHAALTKLLPSLKNLAEAPAEVREDRAAAIRAVELTVVDALIQTT